MPAYGVDADADGGEVTLRGAVDIALQRDAAERIAMRAAGASKVRNRLKVWIAVSAEDVAERVTDAIADADEITVTFATTSSRSPDQSGRRTSKTLRSLLPRGRRASSASGTRSASWPDAALAYATRPGLELWGSTRPSWLREVMSSLLKTLRRW